MARRRGGGFVDDLLEIFSRLPWWIGVIVAVVAYGLLHQVAVQLASLQIQPSQVGAMAGQTIWKTLAGIGQYLIPALCLLGAGVSAWRRHYRKRLVIDVAQSRAADALDGMTWQAFEMLVGEAFRLQGYQVAETGGCGADGGVDLVLTKGGEKFLVQCKQWRAMKVGVEIVRELYGLMAAPRRDRWFRRDLGAVHRGRHEIRERAQCAADRWRPTAGPDPPGQSRTGSSCSTGN